MLSQTTAILALIVLVLLSLFAFAAPQTLTGTITDTMCGKKHMIAGNSDAECTRECMKSKGEWTYGLVVDDKVYTLTGDSKKFDSLVGRRATVTGEVTGTKVTVQTITAAK